MFESALVTKLVYSGCALLVTIFGVFVAFQRINPGKKAEDKSRYVKHPVVLDDLPEEVKKALNEANQIRTDLEVIKKEIESGVNSRLDHLDNDVSAIFHRLDKLIDLLIQSNKE